MPFARENHCLLDSTAPGAMYWLSWWAACCFLLLSGCGGADVIEAPGASQLAMRGPHHPRGSHLHHRPDATKLTQDTNLLRDEQHIREDLENLLPGEDTEKMSPEELEFYYFKLHDFDNNTKLDGLEILQAIQHVLHSGDDQGKGQQQTDEGGKNPDHVEEAERMDDDFSYFVELIDKVLEEDDLDHDGFLSYVEYVQGRKKDQIKRDNKNKII